MKRVKIDKVYRNTGFGVSKKKKIHEPFNDLID